MSEKFVQHLDFSQVREIDVFSFQNKMRNLQTEIQLNRQNFYFHILWKILLILPTIALIAAAVFCCKKFRNGSNTKQASNSRKENTGSRLTDDFEFQHIPPRRDYVSTSLPASHARHQQAGTGAEGVHLLNTETPQNTRRRSVESPPQTGKKHSHSKTRTDPYVLQ